MAIGIKIKLHSGLYIRDPQETTLGLKIIKHSILLIDEIGIEAFNFKKLAERMESTEASVYRYFENKHLLLIYLLSWYWEWLIYMIDINTRNIEDPKRKLKIIIRTLVDATEDHPATDFVNEQALHNIVVAEGTKAYHTKLVDKENREGFFQSYKQLTQKVSAIIQEVNPDFLYPKALASSLFEMVNSQIFYGKHMPSITEVKVKEGDFKGVEQVLAFFAFNLLEK